MPNVSLKSNFSTTFLWNWICLLRKLFQSNISFVASIKQIAIYLNQNDGLKCYSVSKSTMRALGPEKTGVCRQKSIFCDEYKSSKHWVLRYILSKVSFLTFVLLTQMSVLPNYISLTTPSGSYPQPISTGPPPPHIYANTSILNCVFRYKFSIDYINNHFY